MDPQKVQKKIAALNAAVQALLANTQGLRHQDDDRKHDLGIKIDVKDFEGFSHDPESYLDQEKGLERFFDFKETSEEKRFKIAKSQLTKKVETWLQEIQRQRKRKGQTKIRDWDKLKRKMRRKYVPP